MKIMPVLLLSALLAISACDKFPLASSGNTPAVSGTFTTQGYDLLAKEQPRAALALFEQAVAENERNIHALQGKGIALNRLGKHGEAEAAYEQALKIDPEDVGINNNLAMSKILRGKYEEAISILSPLNAKYPTNATVAENIALANCLLGKQAEARKLYSKRLPTAKVEENLRFCKKYQEMRKK